MPELKLHDPDSLLPLCPVTNKRCRNLRSVDGGVMCKPNERSAMLLADAKECPWPHLMDLQKTTFTCGKHGSGINVITFNGKASFCVECLAESLSAVLPRVKEVVVKDS